MRIHRPSRRELLELCIVRGGLVAATPLASTQLLAMYQKAEQHAAHATAAAELGPFFKKGAPNQTQLRAPGDPGFGLRVSGNVVNTRGDIVPGARLDIWQADHLGHYDVAGYRYRTKLIAADKDAGYAIESVMPGHYPDRVAQHVHYFVTAPGHKPLITQLYFATDPVFKGDPDKHYTADPLVTSRELVRPVTLYEKDNSAIATVRFDICLERA